MFLRPSTTPTPIICPTTPHPNVSARVKPAGSPVCRPESLASNFKPAVAFRFADGANPNRPANNIRLVEVTIIKFVGEPMKSQRAPRAPCPLRLMGRTATKFLTGESDVVWGLSPLNCGREVITTDAIDQMKCFPLYF